MTTFVGDPSMWGQRTEREVYVLPTIGDQSMWGKPETRTCPGSATARLPNGEWIYVGMPPVSTQNVDGRSDPVTLP